MKRAVVAGIALLVAACAGAPPRQVLDAATRRDAMAAWLPAGYEGELFVDWQRLREIDLLDRLLGLPMMAGSFAALARRFGADPETMLRQRTVRPGRQRDDAMLTIIESAATATRAHLGDGWQPVSIGGHVGVQWGDERQPAVLWPGPGLAVSGPRSVLAAVAEGRQPIGGPHPELAPLLAGEGVLVQFVYGRYDATVDDVLHAFGALFGDRDDPVDFIRMRLHEATDGTLVASVTLRFRSGGSGRQAAERLVRARLDAMRADRMWVGCHDLLGAVTLTAVERDLTAQAPLGTPRQAVAAVERAVLAVLALQRQRG